MKLLQFAFLIQLQIIICSCGLLQNILRKALNDNPLIKGVLSITDEELDLFLSFEKDYKKSYSSTTDRVLALVNFVLNLHKIVFQDDQYNAGLSTFKIGIWEYSDLKAEDIVNLMTGFKRQPQAKSVHEYDFPTNVPDYVNYTEKSWVNGVLNQGFCGCCWAFSALGALEGQLAKKTGQLIKLSEQNLIDCNKDEVNGNWGCNGGDMKTVFEFIKTKSHGINAASFYRYKGQQSGRCNYDSTKKVATVQEYSSIEPGDEYILMLALADKGPLSIAVDASLDSFQNYKSGVYDDPRCSQNINHAVLLVGYGTDEIGGDYWLIKNSWGLSYGERGYIRIARNRGNLCGVAGDISYPIV